MTDHISQEFINACYDVIEHCNRTIFTCRDLETCAREEKEACLELPAAMGACGNTIQACKQLIERALIHLDRCDIPECSKRTQSAIDVCNKAITQCSECIQECMDNGNNCANFSQKSARTCEDVIAAIQTIIDHL